MERQTEGPTPQQNQRCANGGKYGSVHGPKERTRMDHINRHGPNTRTARPHRHKERENQRKGRSPTSAHRNKRGFPVYALKDGRSNGINADHRKPAEQPVFEKVVLYARFLLPPNQASSTTAFTVTAQSTKSRKRWQRPWNTKEEEPSKLSKEIEFSNQVYSFILSCTLSPCAMRVTARYLSSAPLKSTMATAPICLPPPRILPRLARVSAINSRISFA